MMESQFDLSICLVVKTDKAVESISAIMGTAPTRMVKAGETQLSFIPKSDKNVWVLRKRYAQQTDVGVCLDTFLGSIPNVNEKIHEVNQYGVCTLRVSIISLMGQIGFSLSPYNMQLLNQLGIPLEVSIFSYGYCIDAEET